jgi:hypothetical protein
MKPAKAIWSNKPRGKKSADLWSLLVKLGFEPQCEMHFDWLFVPTSEKRCPEEQKVLEALIKHCENNRMSHKKKCACNLSEAFADSKIKGRARTLEFDFYLPKPNIAIEFDERQHFTMERYESLNHYDGIQCHFSVKDWQGYCSNSIVDPDPICRDWQRAFRDAVRDIRASKHGVKLLRVHYKNYLGADSGQLSAELLKALNG